jgi:hypothetical protein
MNNGRIKKEELKKGVEVLRSKRERKSFIKKDN